ncbi:hypothetical protein ABIA06_002138 [Bradyrhizobium yuanmingense]|uniref:hypothetical protein n=1 Tax=Bradyrhizobium yuanmingense TaxID=108015 RepID=UPI003518F6A4
MLHDDRDGDVDALQAPSLRGALATTNPESLNRAVWIASLLRLDESGPELARLAPEITEPRGKSAWLVFQHAQLS